MTKSEICSLTGASYSGRDECYYLDGDRIGILVLKEMARENKIKKGRKRLETIPQIKKPVTMW
jgi:hypothetical protein